jgi:hypothetical protein
MTSIRIDLSQFLGSLSAAAIGGQAISDNTVAEAKDIYKKIKGLDKFSPNRMLLGQLEIKADVMLVPIQGLQELDNDSSDQLHGHLIDQLEQLFKLHSSSKKNSKKSFFGRSKDKKAAVFTNELGALLRGTLKSGLN